MQDVKLVIDERGLYDLAIDPIKKDFDSVYGMDNAVPVSLFTDDRAESSLVPNAKRRRGGIANVLLKEVGRSLGTTLWAYEQARNTQETRNAMQLSAQDGLSWMIEDGAAREVTVNLEAIGSSEVEIDVNVTMVDNQVQRYHYLWNLTEGTLKVLK